MAVERRYRNTQASIASGAALSDAVDMRPYAGGILSMPGSWTAASLAFYHSATIDGTFQPLYDSTNTLVEMTVAASREYALPDAVFGCAFIKLWSETSGSGVNQSSGRTLGLTLKG